MSTFEDNLSQLKTRIMAMIAAGQVPIVFLDLDETLNRYFGASIEEHAVNSLYNLSEAGGLFGLNTGADIFWAGERVLRETDPIFPFPFLLLATGKQIYAWVESLQAYVLLPIHAENKGEAMRKLTEYLHLPLSQLIFIGDFPGAGQGQEGIDDPVLREQVSIILNVGVHRRPEEIKPLFQETLVLHPEVQGERLSMSSLFGSSLRTRKKMRGKETVMCGHTTHNEKG